jgi:hypothetical protein
MFKRMTAILATMLAVLMAVGIGAAMVTPGSDDSAPSSSTTTLQTAGDSATTIYEVGDAGSVTVTNDGSSLAIVEVAPATGWVTEVEVAVGREVEADFRSGTRRIQFDAELEDGQVKTRVRESADAGGSTTTTSTTAAPSTTSTTSTTMAPGGGDDDSSSTTVYRAGDGGTVTIAVTGSTLTIVSVDTAAGWSHEVEVASGREVEADFRNGARRIQFNAEFEDGEVRIRVRDGLTDDSSGSSDDSRSGDDSGHGSDDDENRSGSDDDNSGHGSDDDHDDDGDDNSGHGSDDDHDDDDHGGDDHGGHDDDDN